jgi:protein phosphatase PTC2/3
LIIEWILILSGDRVAKYAGEHVHQIVRKQPTFEKENYALALQDGFVATDTALMEGIYPGFGDSVNAIL